MRIQNGMEYHVLIGDMRKDDPTMDKYPYPVSEKYVGQ